MYYSAIKYKDIANGLGVRTVLFVSGCRNHCKGCFQPDTWDFSYGKEYTPEVEEHILRWLDQPLTDGLTLLGGEPMEPENQQVLAGLARRLKKEHPDKTIWCFTGFVYDRDLLPGQRKHTGVTDEFLSLIDVLVDGPFILERRNLALTFRGSENQRVLDMKKTLAEGRPVLYLE